MVLEDKNIVATLYLKNGKAVKSPEDTSELGEVYELCRLYNDSGIDKIIIFDLSKDDIEQQLNLNIIRTINRNLEIKVCAGGNINGMDDVKRFLYAGCLQVILNGSKPSALSIATEASQRFGKDRILVSVKNVDFIFKNQKILEETFHELLLLDSEILDSVENITMVPHVVTYQEFDFGRISEALKRKAVRGFTGPFICNPRTDVMDLKARFSDEGIKMDNFAPDLKWSDLKLNSDGMIPVIVQDYRTDEVLMLAYMNEEAFNTTIRIGKMTYFSRSRQELWIKGLTSGHIQYVKSLTADCDYDTILAKVAQVGAACHTGNRTCFFNEIVKKEYMEKNPLRVLESIYDTIQERKSHPVDGSYTSVLFEKGTDEILKFLGKESMDLLVASANPEKKSKIPEEISDLLYSCMVLMVEKGITWEDITGELSQR